MKPIKKTDANKAWNRKKSVSDRTEESVEPAKIIYIFTEGINTEVAYFKSFPVVSAQVTPVGLGLSRTKLVEESIKRKDSIMEEVSEDEKEKFSFWCVYDQDIELPSLQASGEHRKKDFDSANTLALENGFSVAFSNDSFELWFLLHHEYHDIAWTRKEYYTKLSELWNVSYEKEGKKKEFCASIYQRILEYQPLAIANANKLWKAKSSSPPSEQNPCTKVFQLVELLNKYIRK